MSLVHAFIALGSNLGDRLGQMQFALKALAADDQLKVLQISPVYENRAVGMGEADDFLNAMAEVETSMAPLALLDLCLEVESKFGRVRTKEWAPRTIDLDSSFTGMKSLNMSAFKFLTHASLSVTSSCIHSAPSHQIWRFEVNA